MRYACRVCPTFTLLAVMLLALAEGCGQIQSVGSKTKEYVVEFATKTGEVVREKAKTLAEAIEQAWRAFFPKWDKTKTVKITSADGLHGELQGVFQLKVVLPPKNDAGGLTVEITLHNPLMCRKTVDDDFSLDPVNFPENLRKEYAKSP